MNARHWPWHRCAGASHLLVKPCDPADVLRTIEAVLPHTAEISPSSRPQPIATTQTLIPTAKPALRMMTELTVADRRLIAQIEFRQQLASEHDPRRVLEGFCGAAAT